MKVSEIMERAGIGSTGRAIAYIKDGLEEIEMHTKQNVVRGSLATYTGNDIQFIKNDEEFTTSQQQWDGINDAPSSSTAEPTGWSEWESEALTDTQYNHATTNSLGEAGNYVRIIPKADLNSNKRVGIYKSMTVIPNIEYTFTGKLTKGLMETATQIGSVWVTGAAPSGIYPAGASDGTVYGSGVVQGSESLSAAKDVSITFTSSTTTVYIVIFMYSLDASNDITDKYFEFGDISLKPTNSIISTGNFSSFTSGMKLYVNNSSNNDTSKSDNATNGYYTCSSVDSDIIKTSEELNDESAGASLTIRGQSVNYMDIIKDKRFYPLPDDMLKLIDVKVKNHKNGNDKYRSVERMIYKPSEQDGDNV